MWGWRRNIIISGGRPDALQGGGCGIDLLVEAVNESTVPDNWKSILEYISRYPEFSFSSARLSKVFGVSSQKISKLLLQMSRSGYLEKRTRGNNRTEKSYYKWKKTS